MKCIFFHNKNCFVKKNYLWKHRILGTEPFTKKHTEKKEITFYEILYMNIIFNQYKEIS